MWLSHNVIGRLIMIKKNKKCSDTVKSLDLLLNDLFEQIKNIGPELKDAPYPKLMELFLKGVDLKQKVLSSADVAETGMPKIATIVGLDTDLV